MPRTYSAEPCSNVFKTSAAWPFTETLSQILWIFPSLPIQNVMRTIPRNDFPRNRFMRRAPYASIAVNSGSDNSGKFSLCRSLNFACVATLSALHPITTASSASNFFFASRNSVASLVQPGVSAFGKK
jgi:hypothetical protein